MAIKMIPTVKTKAKSLPPAVILRDGFVSDLPNESAELDTIASFSGITTNAKPNKKTGPMVQIRHQVRGILPHLAVETGQDSAVCGNCPLRPFLAKAKQKETGKKEPKCYVQTAQGERQVYLQNRAGNYPHLDELPPSQQREIQQIMAHFGVRFGAYGEPVSDMESLERVSKMTDKWTGYTHQWQANNDKLASDLLMASLDGPDTHEEAKEAGFRTYRHTDDLTAIDGEIQCLENTRGLPCNQCLLCSGNAGKGSADIVVNRIPK
tara:strand:- start:608 stop:1402 length:795 start_codon:yes stop_codon:yes gene_type:complete